MPPKILRSILWSVLFFTLLPAGLAAQTTTAINISTQAPTNNATVNSPVMQVISSATGPYTVFAMQVFVDNVWKASISSNSIDIGITVTPGKHVVTLYAWDITGHYQTQTINVTASAVQHSATLGWNASPSSVMGYNIYRSTNPSGPFTRVNSEVEPATVFTDRTVTAGQLYYYAVTSVNTEGESAYSNLVTSLIPAD